MSLAALQPGHVAAVTGGASGIGLAACRAFASRGLALAVIDRPGDRLDGAVASLGAAGADVAGFSADVADRASLAAAEAAVRSRFGRLDVLMANAAIQPGSAIEGDPAAWDRVLAVNLHGPINTVQAFMPLLLQGDRDRSGLVVVTGSKQGITTPPGDPAYNVAKAGVKAFAEGLEHHLRERDGRHVSAHLLIPGFVWTPLTMRDRTEKPDAAWTPEQTVGFMMERLTAGDFYILCPDNDVDRALDERRILWAVGDIVQNRPPLSRWHPDHAEAFRRFVAEG